MKTRKISYIKIFKFLLLLFSILVVMIILVTILNRKTIKYINNNITKVMTIDSKTDYAVEYIYDEKMPSSAEPITIHEGSQAILDKDNNVITKAKSQVVKVGLGPNAIYTGKMTGYGADCVGCSGNLSCKTKNGKRHNLYTDGEIYEDESYGRVRILAASLSLFPCGTIISVDNGRLDKFNAIVLDTGYSVENAWKNNTIWLDLAFRTEKDTSIYKATSKNTTYSVQRFGW